MLYNIIENSNHDFNIEDLEIMDIETLDSFNGTTLANPTYLCKDGNNAWNDIVKLFKDELDESEFPPNRVFYSPSEWMIRGEVHGLNSVLIIVHEEGLHSKYFDWDCIDYEAMNKLQECLGKDLYCEQCTTWYSAIYLKD